MSAVASSGPGGSCPAEKGECLVTSYVFSINFLRLLVSLTIPFNNLVKLVAVLVCRRFDHTPKANTMCVLTAIFMRSVYYYHWLRWR